MTNLQNEIMKVIPDFEVGRCRSLRRTEIAGRGLRLVVDYAGEFEITVVAEMVDEMPVFRPAAAPGILPYEPYDLDEFMIAEFDDHVVLFDELNGWRIQAASILLEGIDQVSGRSA